MKVVIIDYGAGNIFSVQQAFRRIGVESFLSADATEIQSADYVVFPGVGHAKPAMEQLKLTGLDKMIPDLRQPVLGICLGMQLMCGWNEEGNLEGLGIFETRVFEFKKRIRELQNSENLEFEKSEISKFDNSQIRKFDNYRRPQENAGVQQVIIDYQTPHMGWNDVYINETSEPFYFVHSYAAEICKSTLGITEYPFPFSASLKKDNFLGVQFHPEKSGKAGEQLLKQFLEL